MQVPFPRTIIQRQPRTAADQRQHIRRVAGINCNLGRSGASKIGLGGSRRSRLEQLRGVQSEEEVDLSTQAAGLAKLRVGICLPVPQHSGIDLGSLRQSNMWFLCAPHAAARKQACLARVAMIVLTAWTSRPSEPVQPQNPATSAQNIAKQKTLLPIPLLCASMNRAGASHPSKAH